ncbi:type I secretion system permease/ATPase [Sinorhizobium alkalisoli]|uniref:Protease/lipase ABC transporter permease/ATP-binding protein n=1 Tax=Sinorhizobium alkalisoli TaxID=1752398 RepID=A0A1E3VA86_9HYPH|nr:type I secretion system permease/ATPase [Sinorhizobium alkalisoli]ODR90440.1 protease/lipase ABC transporter permease/ATP-binding protein [Sinorhizobium alkalisoli]
MADTPAPSLRLSASDGEKIFSAEAVTDQPQRKIDAEAAGQQLLREIDNREDVLNSTVKKIDGVLYELRGGAAASDRPGTNPANPTPSAPIGEAATASGAAARPESARQARPAPKAVPPVEAEVRPELRDQGKPRPTREADEPAPRGEKPAPETKAEAKSEVKDKTSVPGMVVIDGDRGPIKTENRSPDKGGSDGGGSDGGGNGGGGKGGGGVFHKRLGPVDFSASLKAGLKAIRQNLMIVMVFTIATNVLVLAIPVYLFQISDRVLTSRSVDTLVMLTVLIVGAVILQAVFDGIRRMILMRTAVEVAAQLGAPILSAAARASLHSNGREYQTLGDLQQLRSFLVSGTLLSFLDAPIAPFFVAAVFLIHPHLGSIVIGSSLLLLIVTVLNQKATAASFGEANSFQTRANLHLDSMSRNSQIINALAMIPETVRLWGKDMAGSLKSQVLAQDRNIAFASLSKAVRLLTQVSMLGWGANLALQGELTGGMVIAASIIAGRALGPIEGAIEGWNQVIQSRAAYGRITSLLQNSPLNFERLKLPQPEGRLDVERLLFVPQGTKRVVLNGVSFSLNPGDSLAVIGSSGAGKTTLGKMLVGSILPTSGNVRLDLMDLRNWDQRQFGENIGYLPQDVQLFPGTIKANIARMQEEASDADIYAAAKLADVHDMIALLPHGYETFVTADGSPLSGGQKQRVALARAFFGNPRMVVLDEPNSNLDSAGEVALTRALQHAREQKITVITITQRPALLSSVDKVLLLVNGTVALFGMRQDVLNALSARGMNIEGNPLAQNQLM